MGAVCMCSMRVLCVCARVGVCVTTVLRLGHTFSPVESGRSIVWGADGLLTYALTYVLRLQVQSRGEREIKGKGRMATYFLQNEPPGRGEDLTI